MGGVREEGITEVDLPVYTLEFDYVGGSNPIYIGSAIPGSLTSDAVWQIKKLEYDGSNNILSIKYAAASPAFSQIWDDRAALSYS